MKRVRGKFAVRRGTKVIKGTVDVQRTEPARESDDAVAALRKTGHLSDGDDLNLLIRHEHQDSDPV
jgi:hypothetical protein